jgi:hypothetical protein
MTWGGLDCHRSRSARRAERGRLSRRHPISPDGAEHRHRPQNSLLSPTPSSTASADPGGMPGKSGQPLPSRQPQAPTLAPDHPCGTRQPNGDSDNACCLRNPSARACGHCAQLLLNGLMPVNSRLSSAHGRNLLTRDCGQVYTFSEVCSRNWYKAGREPLQRPFALAWGQARDIERTGQAGRCCARCGVF